MKDFANWYEWILQHVGYIERSKAQALYDQFYTCDCEGCKYRKEQGQIPHQAGNKCKLPLDVTSQLEKAVRAAIA